MADFYAARAGTNAGAPLDGFLTAVHSKPQDVVRDDAVITAYLGERHRAA